MAYFTNYEPCPRCRAKGRDRRGDNLGRYSDGSGHCYSCGHHEWPKGWVIKPTEEHDTKEKVALPRDFTREIPADAWKWLLQYGLSYSYWKPYCGYSPSEERLVITHGSPIETSVGRYVGKLKGAEAPRKWKQYGDKLRSATFLEPTQGSSYEGIVLVEDLVSAHKVCQVAVALPLFGVSLYPLVIAALRPLKRPVSLWLDADQYTLLPPKINRLKAFLNVPVNYIRTDKDPKEYSSEQIKEILSEQAT